MFTFSIFDQNYPFWANLPEENQNCQSKLKFGTQANLNTQNSMAMCGAKNQNCQFKLKIGTKTNLNKQNSMAMFTFSAFDQKYPFWDNLVQKFKIANLS